MEENLDHYINLNMIVIQENLSVRHSIQIHIDRVKKQSVKEIMDYLEEYIQKAKALMVFLNNKSMTYSLALILIQDLL